jgi:uncharacterized protein YdhG (YjbR/CyaY superfamily)
MGGGDMSDYNFIWLPPSAGAPIVSIASYGISFNSAVIEMLGRPTHVLIGFDEQNQLIGVKPVPEGAEEPRSYKFAERERQGTIRIGNKDFLKYISSKSAIDLRKTSRYLATWDNENQVLVIDLKSTSLDNMSLTEDGDDSVFDY